jgi:hypothetical protein
MRWWMGAGNTLAPSTHQGIQILELTGRVIASLMSITLAPSQRECLCAIAVATVNASTLTTYMQGHLKKTMQIEASMAPTPA